MAWGSTQPLRELSTRKRVKGGWGIRLTTLVPSVSEFSRKYGTLDVSEGHVSPWPVTGIKSKVKLYLYKK
jgi:hypothetical protein